VLKRAQMTLSLLIHRAGNHYERPRLGLRFQREMHSPAERGGRHRFVTFAGKRDKFNLVVGTSVKLAQPSCQISGPEIMPSQERASSHRQSLRIFDQVVRSPERPAVDLICQAPARQRLSGREGWPTALDRLVEVVPHLPTRNSRPTRYSDSRR